MTKLLTSLRFFRIFWLCSGLVLSLTAINPAFANTDAPAANKQYDAQLAKQLDADERGMKLFVLVILKTGPNDAKITDKEQRMTLFRGHFSNMERLANEGKLLVAGPLGKDKPKRGILVFDVSTIAEAEKLVSTDPTVEAGIFDYDLATFYGPAGLMLINDIQKTLLKPK